MFSSLRQIQWTNRLHRSCEQLMATSRKGSWLAVLILTAALPAGAQKETYDPRSMAPYVPTPIKVVHRMLKLGGVKSGDMVYDLGSGDGRIVITAAQEYGAKAVGVELDSDLAERANARIKELNISDRANVMHAHLMEVDLRAASVVTLYLLSSSNMQLRPKLEQDLKPGARVISHDFQIMGWTPVKTETVKGDTREHTIFVYEIGKH